MNTCINSYKFYFYSVVKSIDVTLWIFSMSLSKKVKNISTKTKKEIQLFTNLLNLIKNKLAQNIVKFYINTKMIFACKNYKMKSRRKNKNKRCFKKKCLNYYKINNLK